MKFYLILLTIMSSNLMAMNKGDLFLCKNQANSVIIEITQNSDAYTSQVKEKCKYHKDIQYEWEQYAFFTLKINGDMFSGVGCNEDVHWEFQTSKEFQGHKLSFFMYLDELEYSTLSIGVIAGSQTNFSCEFILDAGN